jgi:hypothetical protein
MYLLNAPGPADALVVQLPEVALRSWATFLWAIFVCEDVAGGCEQHRLDGHRGVGALVLTGSDGCRAPYWQPRGVRCDKIGFMLVFFGAINQLTG